jgi:hypothetical protein
MLKWGHVIRKERRYPVATDPSSPAENHEHASQGHPAQERVDPGTFAHQLFEHIANVHGDANTDLYASRVVAELFELSPIVREHISDLLLLTDLTEELYRRGRPGREAARMVAEVQRDWSQGA